MWRSSASAGSSMRPGHLPRQSWRARRDSNPQNHLGIAGFQDRNVATYTIDIIGIIMVVGQYVGQSRRRGSPRCRKAPSRTELADSSPAIEHAMDVDIVNKIILFWVIFFITPGPVWVSVMETTRNLSNISIWKFFIKTFLPVNLSVQVTQTIICVAFVDLVSKVFSDVGLWFYVLGGSYILYLSYKVLSSKQSNTNLELSFSNLAMVMILSPKIWLLFPSGAIIATQLEQGIIIRSLVFSISMLAVSNLVFVIYVFIGKIGTKLLKDNFSYLSFFLLVLFSVFLFTEAINLV
jgi:threonine/homoserine/homoserine lactone efflux protein